MFKLYDIKLEHHGINDEGDETFRTLVESDAIPLAVVHDMIEHYVEGNYELVVKEHKEE